MAEAFDPAALERLREAARAAPVPPSLHLHLTDSPSELGDRLHEAALQVVKGTGGAVALTTEAAVAAAPVLTLRAGEREAIHYRAPPEGPEAGPFLEALLALAGGAEDASAAMTTGEIAVEVFISPTCPNCPQAVRAAVALAASNPRITVTVLDASDPAVAAVEVGVRSVPTTVVDGGLTVVGVVTVGELTRRIADGRGPRGWRVVLESQLEAGRFAAAARLLLDDQGREAFAELWQASTLESRIGLVLAAQEALDRDPGALDGLVEHLLPSLEAVDAARRGDTVDLLGRIGHPAARRDLELLRRDPVADVAEAAEEALESLRDGG